MSLKNIVQRTSTYAFFEPEYTQVIDDATDLLSYLKDNISNESDPNHKAMKNLFWEVIMRIANFNQFQSKTKN